MIKTNQSIIIKFIIFTGLMLQGSLLMATSSPLLVEPDWLSTHINNKNLVIVDVRGHDEYLKSHLQNAVSIPVDQTFATGARSDLLAPISVIRHLLNAAGIHNSSHIVVYDDGSFIDAGRFFWIMEMFGHARVSILNLGFEKWKTKGYVTTEVIALKKPASYVPEINPDRLATLLQLLLMIDNPEHTLLDVRSHQEYMGLASKTDVYGHIPGAINIPATGNIDVVKLQLKPLSELSDLYHHLDKSQPVTVYCNNGKQAALSYFVLRNLGFRVSAYDGSWYEWSQYSGFPVENPSSKK